MTPPPAGAAPRPDLPEAGPADALRRIAPRPEPASGDGAPADALRRIAPRPEPASGDGAPADALRRIAADLAATARRLDRDSPAAQAALAGCAARLGDALAALPAGSPPEARLALLVLLAELQELTQGLAGRSAALARRLGDVALGRAVAAAYRRTRRL